MAVAQRILGQRVSVSVLLDGALQVQIDTIQSAEIEMEQDLIEEGYLGEVADRVDSVFKLVRVRLSGHANSKAYLDLADAIVKRSQSRAGGAVQIDVVGSFAFPNGDFPTIVIPNIYFEALPFTIGGRDEHVTFELNGKASGYSII